MATTYCIIINTIIIVYIIIIIIIIISFMNCCSLLVDSDVMTSDLKCRKDKKCIIRLRILCAYLLFLNL